MSEVYTIDYRPISAIIQQLPVSGKWTKSHRSRWLQAMEANVDFLIEVIDDREAPDPHGEVAP